MEWVLLKEEHKHNCAQPYAFPKVDALDLPFSNELNRSFSILLKTVCFFELQCECILSLFLLKNKSWSNAQNIYKIKNEKSIGCLIRDACCSFDNEIIRGTKLQRDDTPFDSSSRWRGAMHTQCHTINAIIVFCCVCLLSRQTITIISRGSRRDYHGKDNKPNRHISNTNAIEDSVASSRFRVIIAACDTRANNDDTLLHINACSDALKMSKRTSKLKLKKNELKINERRKKSQKKSNTTKKITIKQSTLEMMRWACWTVWVCCMLMNSFHRCRRGRCLRWC